MRPTGPIPAEIMIIGEAPGREEEIQNIPFVGPSGGLLNNLLRRAGLERDSCFVSNVCNERPPGNDIGEWISERKTCPEPSWVYIHGKWCHPNVSRGIDLLYKHIEEVNPKLIIALGNTPLWALTGNTGIMKWRGSRLSPPGVKCNVLPTIHPAACLRQRELIPILAMDLKRAKAIYEGRQVPRVYKFLTSPTFQDTIQYLDKLLDDADRECLLLSGDLETRAGHIACFGIARSKREAICIPFLRDNEDVFYWSESEEAAVVYRIVRLFLHGNIVWVGQNFLYDCQYFHRFWCAVPLKVWDTMIGQHSIYSTLRKGLDFLSSMYAQDHIYWKDEIKEWDPKLGETQFWEYNCLSGHTPILCKDFTYKPLRDIQVGDEILAFEEGVSGDRYARRLKTATVTKTFSTRKKAYRYRFSDGTYLDGTPDHKVISTGGRNSRPNYSWKELDSLEIGDLVVSLGKPWRTRESFSEGWLSGIFDGEGTLGLSFQGAGIYPRLSFSQKKGLVLEKAQAILKDCGYTIATRSKAAAEYIDFLGGLAEQLRFLGEFQPVRLVKRAQWALETYNGLNGFSGLARPSLISVEPLGDSIEVYDITTTESTFIAGGIVVHNCKDCCITYEVWERLQEEQAHEGVSAHFYFKQTLFFPVLRMMNRGMRVDIEARKKLRTELTLAADERQENLNKMTGVELNVRSPVQLKNFFYQDLGIPGIRHMDTHEITTNSTAMVTISQRHPVLNPLCQTILELRSIGVFISTFINAALDTDGRMRCSFAVAGTESDRFKSFENAFGSGANLQNIPKNTSGRVRFKGKDYFKLPNIRKLYIPDPGFTFFDLDLDRADMQVVAAEADDKTLKEILAKGVDIHCFAAAEVFGITGIPMDELIETHPNYPEHRARIGEGNRDKTKNGGHATDYGVQDRKLAVTLGITVHEASRFRARWFGLFPGIPRWHLRVETEVKTKGYLQNPFGARYYQQGDFDLPEALAWGPSSTVAGVINRALVRIDSAKESGESSIQLLLQVHDSLAGQFLSSRLPEEVERLKNLARIEIPYEEKLIIPVGIKISVESWGNCK